MSMMIVIIIFSSVVLIATAVAAVAAVKFKCGCRARISRANFCVAVGAVFSIKTKCVAHWQQQWQRKDTHSEREGDYYVNFIH